MDQKKDPTVCRLEETHTYRLEVNEWRKIYHANTNQKKAEVTVVISDTVDLEQANLSG